MILTVLRTIIMYFFVVLTLRLMGKRQIGELEASELVVTIIISEIAAMPITNLGVSVLCCLSQSEHTHLFIRTSQYVLSKRPSQSGRDAKAAV